LYKFTWSIHQTKNVFARKKTLQNWNYAQVIFPAGFAGQGFFNKEPTVWLDGARPLPKYIRKYVNISYTVGELANLNGEFSDKLAKHLSPNLTTPLVDWLIILSTNPQDVKNVVRDYSEMEISK